jgi:hypothetical protein
MQGATQQLQVREPFRVLRASLKSVRIENNIEVGV